MSYTREIVFRPAYDHRAEGKGQHGVDMIFYLKGEKGIIQFLLMTGWVKGIIGTPDSAWDQFYMRHGQGESHPPLPADLGYHSPVPLYEGQTQTDCHLLPSGKCYYDGSGLNADRIFSLLVHEGGEAVWKALEDEYVLRFKTPEEASA